MVVTGHLPRQVPAGIEDGGDNLGAALPLLVRLGGHGDRDKITGVCGGNHFEGLFVLTY